MAEKVYKTEDGVKFPAEAYAYVPDPESPSTWKLRLWEDLEQKETARQVGMAIAALGPGGFRGNRVDIPRGDLPKVKAKLRAAWKKVHPDASEDDLPALLREGEEQDVVQDGTRLLEYISSANTALRVDRDKGIIHGVKILGLESANKRSYTREALERAVSLYEGKAVNVDHIPSGQLRSYRDRIGRIVNVRLSGDGLYGDLLVNPKHPLAEQLFWDAEHAPENVGLSHDAQGKTVVRDGKMIVESISSVRSVDLVAEPATTRSLYESAVDTVMAMAEPEQSEKKETPEEPEGDSGSVVEDPDSLPDDAFALVLPGGVKIRNKTYPLHKRYFPIHSPETVKRSLRAIANNRKLSADHKELALQRAKDAARKFGIDPEEVLRTQEAKFMDLTTLTLAELKEARPDLVEAIQAQTELQQELIAIKEERDKLAKELAEAKRKEEIDRELRECALSADDIPQTLRELLEGTEDANKRKQAIREFKAVVEARKPVSARSPARANQDLEAIVASWRK